MHVLERFRFDHEETDTERDKANLRWFKEQGIELGAEVTLWYCAPCDFARAEFAYDEEQE